jgi:hypothetical protein
MALSPLPYQQPLPLEVRYPAIRGLPRQAWQWVYCYHTGIYYPQPRRYLNRRRPRLMICPPNCKGPHPTTQHFGTPLTTGAHPRLREQPGAWAAHQHHPTPTSPNQHHHRPSDVLSHPSNSPAPLIDEERHELIRVAAGRAQRARGSSKQVPPPTLTSRSQICSPSSMPRSIARWQQPQTAPIRARGTTTTSSLPPPPDAPSVSWRQPIHDLHTFQVSSLGRWKVRRGGTTTTIPDPSPPSPTPAEQAPPTPLIANEHQAYPPIARKSRGNLCRLPLPPMDSQEHLLPEPSSPSDGGVPPPPSPSISQPDSELQPPAPTTKRAIHLEVQTSAHQLISSPSLMPPTPSPPPPSASAQRQEQAHVGSEKLRQRKKRKACLLQFISRRHSYDEICSYGYEDLLSLTHADPLCPEDCESLTEEDLLIHALSSHVLEERFDAEAVLEEASKVFGGVKSSSSSHSSPHTTTPTIHCTSAFLPAVSLVHPPLCDDSIMPFQPSYKVEKSRPPPAPNWMQRPPPAPNWHWRYQVIHNKYLKWINQYVFCAEETYWRGKPFQLTKLNGMAFLIDFGAIVFLDNLLKVQWLLLWMQ